MGEFTYFFVLASIGGFALGIIIMVMLSKFGLNRDQQKAKLILEEANIKSDNIVRQAILDAKTQTYDLKLAAEKEIKESRQTLQEVELKLNRREDSLNFRSETLTSKEKELELRNNQVTEKLNVLEKMEANLKEKIDGQVAELERIANMSSAEAKNELMDIVRVRTQNEIEAFIRDQEEEAKAKASSMAKEIIGLAIQRYAQEETLERTVSVVGLPNEEMKGRIIGREGRNIRAIEQATGVDILIDDTPETITLSCFDPIRREVARLALETLLKDG
ncbi:MAG: Rnase Y domain-containing protein, partial [Erysipelotrichaceae bacterium]